jgi:O-antigen/teichoic acid export membrane protein
MVSTPVESLAAGEKPSIVRRFVRAARLTTGAGIVARVLQLLLPFFVAKLISRPDFGIFTIVTSTVAVGAELGQLGQNATVQKFLPQFVVRQGERVGALVDTIIAISVVCLLVLATLLFFTSHLIALRLYGDASLANYLRVAAVLLTAAGLFNVFCGTLAGLQEFGKFSAAQLIRSSILLVLSVPGAVAFGLTGVLTAQTAGSLLVAYFIGRFASKTLYGRFGTRMAVRFDRQFLGMITGFSVPVFLSATLVLPAYWLSMARLSRLFGVQEVAQFGIAFGVMQFVILIPGVTSMTALSFLSESHARSDDTFGLLANLNLRVAWYIALITAVFLAFAAPQFLHFAFGKKYTDIHSLMIFMMLVGLAMAICNSVGSVIASTGKMWQALGLNAVWLAMFGSLAIILIPRLASRGLALSYFGSYGIFAVLACIYARHVCHMSLKKTPALIVLSALGFAGAGYTVSQFPHLSAVIGCLATLLLAVLGWKLVMTQQERSQVSRKLRLATKRWTWRSERAPRRERILYVSHVDWGWIKQRPQHLAESLRRFFDVTVAFDCGWRRGNLANKFRISRSCIPLLHIPSTYQGRIPLLARVSAIAARLQLRFAMWLARPTYLWFTWPEMFQYLPRGMKVPVIYDCMDDAGASSRDAQRVTYLEREERALIAKAAIVFVSSERLRHVLETRYGQPQKYHLLRNAFDGKLLPEFEEQRQSVCTYKIGYCGTIAEWFDWELLAKLVEALSYVEVHLIGPVVDLGAGIATHPRITIHHPTKHSDLPAIMGEFDCLIMPFQVTPLIESVDPVKLYEYINFGKPIVSVYYDEITRFAPFVHFYRSHDEALDIVSRLATGEIGRKYSPDERRAFLLVNTWSERASVAAALLKATKECA